MMMNKMRYIQRKEMIDSKETNSIAGRAADVTVKGDATNDEAIPPDVINDESSDVAKKSMVTSMVLPKVLALVRLIAIISVLKSVI